MARPPQQGNAIVERERVSAVGSFGDGSVTFLRGRSAGEPKAPESYVRRGFDVYVRVGAEVVVMAVEAPEQAPPWAVAEGLVAAQVACLQLVGGCPPVPVPVELRPPAAAKTPRGALAPTAAS